MREIFFILLILLTTYCDADDKYFVMKVTLGKEIGETIDIDNFYKSDNGRKVMAASINGRDSNFPVLYVDKILSDKNIIFVFDMPLEIKEAEAGKIGDVVLMLKSEYMSFSCTSVMQGEKNIGPVVLVLDNGKLQAVPIEIIAEFPNNTCLAKSVVSRDGCVVDKPERFRVSENKYKIPGGNNCGNNGMRHIYIKLNGIVDIAQ